MSAGGFSPLPSLSSAGIDVEQLENSIKLAEAKVSLWQQKLATWNNRGTAERKLLAEAAPMLGLTALTVNGYVEAHKNFYEAEAQIMTVTIAEYKSQAAIARYALETARSKITSGRGIIGGV
jgi:hypothetical protein